MPTTEQETISHMERHQVRPTAVRILIWHTIEQFDFVFSLSDLEDVLPTVDKSTLFRTLTVFCEHQMLHQIPDGSGMHKYCICSSYDDIHSSCNHVHLKCNVCNKTFCLKHEQIPLVSVPQGFEIKHITYIIEGICPHCGHKNTDKEKIECCCHNN